MAWRKIEDAKLTAIADVVRSKTGGTSGLTPDQMASALNVPYIVNVSADTVTADGLVEGYTAHDAAGNEITGTNPYAKAATDAAVEDIATAIEGKGVSVPDGTTLDGMAALIDGIASGFEIPTLNESPWSLISALSEMGQAANYWSVGDCKGITVSGTVGTQSVSGTYYVYILGFDHNGAINTIDFGTFKTALFGGTDICLVDSKYQGTGRDGTKYFNMNHWGSSSLPFSTNYGGWKGCDARYDILGSTDTAPSGYGSTATTSRTGYDASTTCAINPVSGTLMSALPSDLRAVMKPMTVYTDNVGNSSNTASGVSASVDYLPLLAEFEIFGTRTYANTYEQNYQARYTYYANGNSRVKYKHSETSSAVNWRERSPAYNYAFAFCIVRTDGNATNSQSYQSIGIAPIFRV